MTIIHTVIPSCQYTRSFASFLLSHIGLLSLVVGYCIMGAFIFEELEKVRICNHLAIFFDFYIYVACIQLCMYICLTAQ